MTYKQKKHASHREPPHLASPLTFLVFDAVSLSIFSLAFFTRFILSSKKKWRTCSSFIDGEKPTGCQKKRRYLRRSTCSAYGATNGWRTGDMIVCELRNWGKEEEKERVRGICGNFAIQVHRSRANLAYRPGVTPILPVRPSAHMGEGKPQTILLVSFFFFFAAARPFVFWRRNRGTAERLWLKILEVTADCESDRKEGRRTDTLLDDVLVIRLFLLMLVMAIVINTLLLSTLHSLD